MWRIGIFFLLIFVVIFLFIFRSGKILRFTAAVVYSPLSPLRSSKMPLWASYYLGKTLYEAPPEQLKQLEENVRVIGYALLAVPITLLVIALAL